MQRVRHSISEWIRHDPFGSGPQFEATRKAPLTTPFTPPPAMPRGFAAAKQAHPVFSRMAASMEPARGASFHVMNDGAFAGSRDMDALSFASVMPNDRFKKMPAMAPGVSSDCLSVKSLEALYQNIYARSLSRSGPTLLEAADEVSGHVNDLLKCLFRQATRDYVQFLARYAPVWKYRAPPVQAGGPSYRSPSRSPSAPNWAPSHPQSTPVQAGPTGPFGSSMPTAGTAPPPPPSVAMPITAERDTAGWAAYVQQLQSRHGWAHAQMKEWIADYQSYVKFGNEEAAAKFNRKYGVLMGVDIEDSDLRANYTQLMKAMLRATRENQESKT